MGKAKKAKKYPFDIGVTESSLSDPPIKPFPPVGIEVLSLNLIPSEYDMNLSFNFI